MSPIFFKLRNALIIPQDCYAFLEAVEKYVVPLPRLFKTQGKKMGLPKLPLGPFLWPCGSRTSDSFKNALELKEKTSRIFHQIDPQLASFLTIWRTINSLTRTLASEKHLEGTNVGWKKTGSPLSLWMPWEPIVTFSLSFTNQDIAFTNTSWPTSLSWATEIFILKLLKSLQWRWSALGLTF